MAKRQGTDSKWIIKHVIELECDDLLAFANTMSSGLQSECDRFTSSMDRITAGMDEHKKAETLELYTDDAFGLMDRYPTILWQSVFISLYSFFEQQMTDVCRRI